MFVRFDCFCLAVGGEHFLVAPGQQDEIRVGAAQGGQACRLGLEQGAHFEQVEQGAWLRAEQVHQRAGVARPVEAGDPRIAALGGLDDAAPAQHLEPLAQGRTGDAQLLAQASFRGQGLAGLEHAVDDQPLDFFGHHIADLAAYCGLLCIHRGLLAEW
ncbi:hypothetical protein D3C71_1722240 [compost metagenome]